MHKEIDSLFIDAHIPYSFLHPATSSYSQSNQTTFQKMPSYNIVVFAGDYCGPEVGKNPFPQNAHHEPDKKAPQVTAEALKVTTIQSNCKKRRKRREVGRGLTTSASDPPGSRESTTAHHIRLPRTSARRGTLHYELSEIKQQEGCGAGASSYDVQLTAIPGLHRRHWLPSHRRSPRRGQKSRRRPLGRNRWSRTLCPPCLKELSPAKSDTSLYQTYRNTAQDPSAPNRACSSCAKNSKPSGTCDPATSPPTP